MSAGGGAALGGAAGASLGSAAGRWIGNKIGTLLGVGEYRVRQNSVLSEGQGPAYMHSDGNVFRLRHREMITQIYYTGTPNTLQNYLFKMNPGDNSTFPWAHTVASCYQEYTLDGAAFYFKSLVNQLYSSTAMTAGQIVMATDYNVLRNGYDGMPFGSLAEAENTQYTTVAKLQSDLYHPIECAPDMNVNNKKWVRTSNVLPLNADARLYDLCKTQLLVTCPVDGSVTPVMIGELWLTYDVCFRKPMFDAGVDQETDIWDLRQPASSVSPILVNTAGLGNNNNGLLAGSSLGCSITTQGVMNFPDSIQSGFYFCQLWYTWAGAAASAPATTITPTNCALIANLFVNGPSLLTFATTTSFSASFMVQITGPRARLAFSNWTVTNANIGNGGMIITAIDSDISFPQNVVTN